MQGRLVHALDATNDSLQAANVAAEMLCTMLNLFLTYLIDGMWLSVDMRNMIAQSG
jgi:hypothetical protein